MVVLASEQVLLGAKWRSSLSSLSTMVRFIDRIRPPADSIQLSGVFKNFNTIEEFRDVETKKKLFNQVVDSVTPLFPSITETTTLTTDVARRLIL